MIRMDSRLAVAGLATALLGLSLAGSGLAQTAEEEETSEAAAATETGGPDTSTWTCSLCPVAEGFSGSVGAGAAYVTDDSNEFGDYTGYDEDGVYPVASAAARYANDSGYSVDVDGVVLNPDSLNILIEAGHQGRWTSRLEWDRLPHRMGESNRTVYRNLGDTPLSLEDDWVRAGSTSGMTSLKGDLRDFDVNWDRETWGFGFDYLLGSRLTLETDYQYQTKEGRGYAWGGFLGNAAQLTRPVDYDTHEAQAGLRYAADDWQLKASVRGSWFNNSDRALTWDNAFVGVDRGRMAQPPDNKAYYADLAGSWNMFRHTTASATFSVGRFEQDDQFLSYTINPDLPVNALPAGDLDGTVDVTHFDLRVTSSPWSRVRLTGEFRYDDRDNDSDRRLWQTVSADAVPGAVEENRPFDYKRWDADVFADVKVLRGFKTSVGYTFRRIERNLQEVDESDEDVYWAKLRFRPGRLVTADLTLESSSRDNDGYEQYDYLNLAQNPLMRKYNMAERDRDGIKLHATVLPASRLSLGVQVESWDEDYDDSDVGLTSADRDSIAADLTYQISDRMSAYASVGHESVDSEQWGAQSSVNPNTADPNWRGKNDDEFNLGSVGFRWDRIREKWGVELDYTYARGESDVALRGVGLNDDFPTLKTRSHTARLDVSYDLNPQMSLSGGWWYARYRSDDWALDGVREDTIGNLLTWGGTSPDYELSVIALRFDYRLAPAPEVRYPPE